MSESKTIILVVDDQQTARHALETMLNDEYDVITAASGRDAVDVALAKLPDLVLLDVLMPGMSGVEVCQKLQNDPLTQQIPVIFITAMDDRESEESGFQAGAVDYIYKPPVAASVKARIRVQLKRKQQVRFIEAVATGYLSDPDMIRQTAKELLAEAR